MDTRRTTPPGPLDPQLAAFNQARAAAAARLPDPYRSPLDIARQAVEDAQVPLAAGGPRMHASSDRWLVIPGRRIQVRLHLPTAAPKLPVLVFLHGGGWVWNSIDTHDRVARETAARGGIAVVAPDYALAPEYPFPHALRECVAVVRWLRAHGHEWGLDGSRIAIGGDSAGGNLALGTALALRDAGEPLLRGALLNYAPLDPSLNTDSYRRFSAQQERMAWYWAQYLQATARQPAPTAAPTRAELHGLPPLRIQVGELDALIDENLALAERARASGIDTELTVYPGMTHAFLRAVGHVDMAARALDEGAAWLRRVLA